MDAPQHLNVRIHQDLFTENVKDAPLTKDNMIKLYCNLLDQNSELNQKYDDLLKENVQINRRLGVSYENRRFNKLKMTESQAKLNEVIQDIEDTKKKIAQSIRTKQCSTDVYVDDIKEIEQQLVKVKNQTLAEMNEMDRELEDLEQRHQNLAQVIDQQKRDVLKTLGK